MKILVVDDSEADIDDLVKQLNNLGYSDIIPAAGGREALARLEENPEIGLIILDRYMPEVDGFEVVKKLRHGTRSTRIAIAIMTSEVNEDEKMRLLMDYDVDYYIRKPVKAPALVRLFSTLAE
ncbi:response regulator [Fibrobacterota bacterium]